MDNFGDLAIFGDLAMWRCGDVAMWRYLAMDNFGKFYKNDKVAQIFGVTFTLDVKKVEYNF
jgi:hypothetical protein